MALFLCLYSIPVSERGASSEKDSFGFGLWVVKQSEEWVVLNADLPEDFALVSTAHQKFKSVLMGALKQRLIKSRMHTAIWSQSQCIWNLRLKDTDNTYMDFWVKLDQETFSFEAQFANLGPIEGIYFCVALREKYRWNKRQTQSSVTLLGYMHKEDIWI